MSEVFVSLAAFLRPPPPAPPEYVPRDAETDGERYAEAACSDELAAEHAAAIGAVRRFRAGLADALDAAVQRAMERIASDVLARELQIAPVELAAIVAKARERLFDERVLAVRVHPTQRDALASLHLEAHLDERLAPGDVVLELRSGTIDLLLRTRLAIALAASDA
jgi:flagellar biosynthesis/type III secretory pathway protein FliH